MLTVSARAHIHIFGRDPYLINPDHLSHSLNQAEQAAEAWVGQ
jgi:hypothetical protein